MRDDALDRLQQIIPRLLLAGAEVARADEELAAIGAAVAVMAARAPALEAVKQRIERFRAARGREAAEELYGLAAAATQIGGARAELTEAPGDLAPLAAHDGVRCDDSVEAVERACDALRGGSWIVPDGDAPLDLRTIGPWVEALSHPSTYLHETAMTILPARAGRLSVAFLRDGLSVLGDGGDGRRIELLAEIEGAAARPLIEEALARGSQPVRASALRALARLAPPEAEGRALAVLADPADPLFDAACGVLAGSSSDAAIDALLARGTAADEAVAGPVLRALRSCRGPRVGAALLAMIPPEIAAIREVQSGYSRGFPAASAALFARFTMVVTALEGHMDEAVSERLSALATEAASMPVRRAAHDAMLASGSNAALAALCQKLRAGDSYQDLAAAVRAAVDRGDAGVLPVLRILVDKLDKSDRELVYLGMVKLGARSEIPWLTARGRTRGLSDRELALVRQALAALA